MDTKSNLSRFRGLVWETTSESSSNEDELLEAVNKVRALRNFRYRYDNLNRWNEQEFFIRFRLRKETVIGLLQEIEEDIAPATGRNHAVTEMQQLLLVLSLYATGCMLVTAGDFCGLNKATACQIVKRVTNSIARLSAKHIKMPDIDNIHEKREEFYNIARFPKVVGAIDCTHIKIQSPGGNNAEYFHCRKGYFSINVQVVGDASLKIMDVVARWSGSSHDQSIFNNCRIKARFEMTEFANSILLGDSGYALTKYLITPLSNPTTHEEQLFNESHIRTRNPIERLFGVWKRRFPILSLGSRLQLKTTKSVIVACAVLHNLAINMGDPEPPQDPELHIAAENSDLLQELPVQENN